MKRQKGFTNSLSRGQDLFRCRRLGEYTARTRTRTRTRQEGKRTPSPCLASRGIPPAISGAPKTSSLLRLEFKLADRRFSEPRTNDPVGAREAPQGVRTDVGMGEKRYR